MKRKLFAGTTSVSLGVFVQDTSSTTGAGLAITHASSGLVFEYRRQGQSSWTSVTPVAGTLGTYTSGGIVADGALTGAIEIGVPDAALASGARFCLIRLRGVTNMLPVLIEIELDAVDYQNATSLGLSRLDAAVSSRMASYTQPTGFLTATFPTTVASTTNITAASGVTLAATTHTGAVIPTVTSLTNAVTTSAFSSTASTTVNAIKTSTDNLATAMELDGSVYRFTVNALEQAPSGGGGGSTDWTADERTAIRSILGIPTSGTTPNDPTTGILDTIRDLVVVVDAVADAIEVDTQNIQSRLPAALVSGRIDSSVGAMASNVITASSIAANALDSKGNWLQPTVAGRTLDVTATGAAGIDWGNVENQDAFVFLINTSVQLVDSVDNVTNVASLNTGAITSTAFATDSLTSTALASSFVNEIRDGVWNATLSSYTTAGTAGLGLSDLLNRVTATVKTMWDNLVSMITGSGASAKYTTTALENAPAGGGGGGGGTDWTANERTAIRSILGIPATGTTPEDPTVGILDTIRDKTNLITSGSVQTALPVTSQGQITGPLYIGDDYLNANGRAFAWTVALPTNYVVGTSTCKFGMAYEDDSGSHSFNVTGTVIDAGSGNVTLRFDVPKATTSTLAAGWYRWSVEHTAADGTEITRIANAANKLVEWREKLT